MGPTEQEGAPQGEVIFEVPVTDAGERSREGKWWFSKLTNAYSRVLNPYSTKGNPASWCSSSIKLGASLDLLSHS